MRRFVVTGHRPARIGRRVLKDWRGNPVMVPVGYWIGPGRPSVVTLHRRMLRQIIRKYIRRAQGRWAG